MERVLDDAVVAFTLCWIASVIFGSLRRYLVAKSQASVQEKIFDRIDSSQALLNLAANDSGRRFLESFTAEKADPISPTGRILYGIQAGVVLTTFGFAMMYLHHVKVNDGPGLLIFGAGAVGLGIGFLIAAAVSLWLFRSLGLLDRDPRG